MASGAACPGPDWTALPAGILRHVLGSASTCQAPGSCLGAPVCRDWRAAAGGCRGIRLLYAAGHQQTDQRFVAWLMSKGPQLEALTISNGLGTSTYTPSGSPASEMVLAALAEAAEAAAATGYPLPLHTLRVLTHAPSSDIVERMMKGLPQLRCSQLDLSDHRCFVPICGIYFNISYHIGAPLKQATQLRELYLTAAPRDNDNASYVRRVLRQLPDSLQRLSWTAKPQVWYPVPDLSHLSNLNFLQLTCWETANGAITAVLSPTLRGLELYNAGPFWSDLQEQRQILTGRSLDPIPRRGGELQQLADFPRWQSFRCFRSTRGELPEVVEALQQLAHLQSVQLEVHEEALRPVVSALCSCQGLRRLQLTGTLLNPSGLAALTQLTWLVVDIGGEVDGGQQQAWLSELGRMPGLRWLSVPHVLLATDRSWLSGLEQLQVLVLGKQLPHHHPLWRPAPESMYLQQVLFWLAGCRRQAPAGRQGRPCRHVC